MYPHHPPPTYPVYGTSLCKPYTVCVYMSAHMYLWVVNHQGLGSILIFGCVSSHPVLVGIETSSIHRPSDHFLTSRNDFHTTALQSVKQKTYLPIPSMYGSIFTPTFG